MFHEAENDNIRLDSQKLALVLAEALSPYSWWARKALENKEKVGYIPLNTGGRPPLNSLNKKKTQSV